MRRAAAIALAALAAAPVAAVAQFRARPMVLPVPSTGTAVLPGAFATASVPGEPDLADLLLARSGAAASLRPHQALLSPLAASPYAQPATFRCVAAGRLAQNAGDALPDVAYCAGALNELQIAFGDAPLTPRSYTHELNTSQTPTLSFARLHPAPRQTDVMVLPLDTGGGSPLAGELYALDFGSAAGAAPMTDRSWAATGITKRVVLPDEILTLRISPTARALGIDDLYVPGFGSVTIYAHGAAPAGSTLADLQLGPGVKVGGTVGEGLDPSAWLPPGIANNDVLGAAALDVDLDGDLDLVVSLAPSAPSGSTPRGKLLWIERTSDVAALATARPWHDLTGHPDLQPLVDPAVLRAIELGGEPAVAVFDRGSDAVVVITADRAGGRLRAWRGSAAGRQVRDLRLADVAGSPAPDLVADATQGGLVAGAPGPAVLVWTDLGDASPELAWAPGSPGAPVRGEDLPLAVMARDPDGPFTVDWILGDPYGAPTFSTGLAGGAQVEVPWVLDGALLCGAPPQTLAVTVRATDALGVFDEVAATLDVVAAAPALALAGAVPSRRLELPPGGTAATLEGSAGARCGAITFTWGGSVLAAAASVVQEDGAGTTRRILDLPEASYPALLAGDPVATLLVTDPATSLQSPVATLELEVDARGLVGAEHGSDAVALAPGEVAVIRTRLRSRIGVPLPQVHVVDLLAGLAPTGAPRVVGAAIVATAAGGAEIVLDALPPAGGEVVIELPVRSLGERGTSAVEVRSSGGHLLTPGASASAPDATAPGCTCGGARGGPGLEALLALAAVLAWRGRASARARAG